MFCGLLNHDIFKEISSLKYAITCLSKTKNQNTIPQGIKMFYWGHGLVKQGWEVIFDKVESNFQMIQLEKIDLKNCV